MEEVKCYICGKRYKSKATLTQHIRTVKDLDHVKYRKHIENLRKVYEEEKDETLIGCKNCKCCQCEENRFSMCLREEKKLYKSVSKKEIKKQENSAPSLLKEFYQMAGNQYSGSWHIELHKIRQMLKCGITPEVIRYAFRVMVSRGEKNLRFFGKYVIQEAIKIKKYCEDMDTKGTLPYLVKQYYKETNTACSDKEMVKSVDRLNRIKHEYSLDDDKLVFVIEYMIRKKIQSFNFLDTIVIEALRVWNTTEKRKEEERRRLSEDHYMKDALSDIINGTTTVDEIMQIYGTKYDATTSFPKKAFTILENKQYNQKYTAMEWAYKVKFHFNLKTYAIAKANTERRTNFIGKEKEEYINWLRNWEYKFRK